MTTYTPVSNRSEILFITDARDCNPNGNPMGDNRPRMDAETQQAMVTDVRLKRYLRAELLDDGHGVLIKTLDGETATRLELVLDQLSDVTEPSDVDKMDDVFEQLTDLAVDFRMFGAMFSFKENTDRDDMVEALNKHLKQNQQGPIHFQPARSFNVAQSNTGYDSLTSVIGTEEGKEQGGFDLDDYRIKFAVFPFYGRIDERVAEETNLRESDVKRLDTLCWHALKNQTSSRSKLGQEPRLYVRVEYAMDAFHIGDLQNMFVIDRDHSKPDEEMRSMRDITLDASEFVATVDGYADRIETVHLLADDRLTLTNNGAPEPASTLSEWVAETGVNVHDIDVYEEHEATRPGA